jgi:hypothetical protein
VPTAIAMIVLAQGATSAADDYSHLPQPSGTCAPGKCHHVTQPHSVGNSFPLIQQYPLVHRPMIRTQIRRVVKVQRIVVPVERPVRQPDKSTRCGGARPEIDYSHGMQVLPRLVTVNVC